MIERRRLRQKRLKLLKKENPDLKQIKKIEIELERTKPIKKRFKKQVLQVDNFGNVLARFDYVAKVKDAGFSPELVLQVLNKVTLFHGGYRWEYGMEQLVECG